MGDDGRSLKFSLIKWPEPSVKNSAGRVGVDWSLRGSQRVSAARVKTGGLDTVGGSQTRGVQTAEGWEDRHREEGKASIVSSDRACWEEGEGWKDGPCADMMGEVKGRQRPQGLEVCKSEPSSRQKHVPQNGQGSRWLHHPPCTYLHLVLTTPLYLEHCLTLCPVSSLSSFCIATPQSQKHLCPSPGDCCSPVFIRIILASCLALSSLTPWRRY